jgi:hypothetical protein
MKSYMIFSPSLSCAIPKLWYHIWYHNVWYDIVYDIIKKYDINRVLAFLAPFIMGYCLRYFKNFYKIIVNIKNLWYQQQLSCIIAYLSYVIAYDIKNLWFFARWYHLLFMVSCHPVEHASWNLKFRAGTWNFKVKGSESDVPSWVTPYVLVLISWSTFKLHVWGQWVPALEVKFNFEGKSLAPSCRLTASHRQSESAF